MEDILAIVDQVVDVVFVFSPILCYGLQVAEMVKTRSADGFSTYVSLIVFMSNLIRIFWWFSEKFSFVLLGTSIVSVVMQFVLIFYWVKIVTNDGKALFKNEAFWYWNKFSTYLTCIAMVIASLGMTTQMIGENKLYSDALGTASAAIEALLPTPQFMLIYKNKHTAGVSLTMILLWVIGDGFKVYYYISNNSPF